MTSEVEGVAAAVERFEAFLRVNRLVGEGLVRNGQILSWRDFDAILAALRAQDERVRVLEGERDEARNAVVKCKDVALAIADRVDDEGDRAYFGSTNDPDTLKALARELDALHWHHVRPAPHPAEARAEAAERRAGELEGALKGAVEHLETTFGFREGWECSEEEIIGPFRALLPATQAEGERKPAPEPPWPAGSATNCKREGWAAFFAGLSRDACPFPPGRQDLQRGYREGWDAAAATQADATSPGEGS